VCWETWEDSIQLISPLGDFEHEKAFLVTILGQAGVSKAAREKVGPLKTAIKLGASHIVYYGAKVFHGTD